jgi:hypothetical protein
MSKGLVPVEKRVKDADLLAPAKSWRFPKFRPNGLIEKSPLVPTPSRPAVLTPALVATESVACLSPTLVGEKVAWTVQESPSGSEVVPTWQVPLPVI